MDNGSDDWEKKRLENIKRNAEVMKSMGIEGFSFPSDVKHKLKKFEIWV